MDLKSLKVRRQVASNDGLDHPSERVYLRFVNREAAENEVIIVRTLEIAAFIDI